MEQQPLSIENVTQLLAQRGHISEAQARDAVVRGEQQRARIGLQGQQGKRARDAAASVTSPEIVASFEFVDQKSPQGDILDEDMVIRILADAFSLDYVKIDPLKLDANLITRTVSLPFARRTNVLPISLDDSVLTVAVVNPFDHALFEELRALIKYEIHPVIASRGDIQRYLTEVHGFKRSVTRAVRETAPTIDIGNLEQLFHLGRVDELESNDQHIVNAVDYLLHYAFSQRASDIHIEPKRERSRIRMRIDGVLHEVYGVPSRIHPAIVSRIKTMSRLDLAEKRRPQDGRFKTRKDDVEVEMRVSSLPVAFGEKIVIRIFDPSVLIQSTEQLGFEGADHHRFMEFVERPNGLVLVTGPTGSGKTTTLYSTLKYLSTPEVNVVSIEDPIEMVIEDFNQIAIHKRIGLTFANALRHVLRQDPDIVMVGEIRDEETAEQALQAALTGHLVLSTLHTNDTATSVTRMLELGTNPYLLASTLVGVVAQRLVRCVCPKCRHPTTLTPQQVMTLGIEMDSPNTASLEVMEGEGCVHCRQTGLYGRTGIFELLRVNDTIKDCIIQKADAVELLRAARADGTVTLRESAIRKMASGFTSFDEVLRTTVDVDRR